MNLAELGEIFRKARLDANLTQQQVAELSGLTRARISLFETGTLPEIGAVKLLGLFNAVGLELIARRPGHWRTLDDVVEERIDSSYQPQRLRVRASASKTPKVSGEETS